MTRMFKPHWGIIPILLVSFWLRFVLAIHIPLFVDELYEASNHVAQTIAHNFLDFRIDAHLLYVLMAIPMASVGWEPVLLRWPAVWAGLLSVAFAYAFGQQLFGRQVALLIAAMFALLPVAVMTSAILRGGYALMIMFSLLSSMALIQALKSGRTYLWVLFAVSTTLAMYAHLFAAVFLIPACLYILWWLRYGPGRPAQRELLRGAVVAGVIIGIGVAVNAGLILQSFSTIGNVEELLSDDLGTDFVSFQSANFEEVSSSYLKLLRRANFTEARDWHLLLYGILVLLGVIGGIRQKQDRWQIAYLLLFTTVPIISVMVMHSVAGPGFRVFRRYLDFALFSYVFLAAYGIWWLSRRIGSRYLAGRWAVAFFLFIVIAAPAHSELSRWYARGQRQQLVSAAHYLQAHSLPNDLIICVARDGHRTKLIRDRCLLTLNFYPNLMGRAMSWQEMKDVRHWQSLVMPNRHCPFNYQHVPVPVRLNMDCVDGVNGPNIWLVFWQQDESEIPYTWDSPLLEAQFGSTRLLYLDQADGLAGNLQSAGELIMADNGPAWRMADNALTLASLQATLGNVAGAGLLLDSLSRSEVSGDFTQEMQLLQQQLPYLNGPPFPAHRVTATWGEQLELRGYTVQASPLLDETYNLTVTLFWLVKRPPKKEYTVFLHWRNAENTNLGQIDFRPYDGLLSTLPWRAGQIIRETRVLQIPKPDPQQIYKLVVGVYELETLQRLPLADDRSHENVFELKWQTNPEN